MKRSLAALPRLLVSLAAGSLLAFVAMPTLADPPTRAARISLTSGNASFSPAGSDEWVQTRVNRPIWIGDRLWSGDGRIELQIGGASLRLAPGTSLQVLNFDDRIAQFEVTRGSVALHVRSIDKDETIEIDTPSFAFVTHDEGDYRIDVEPNLTAVSARRGLADIYGQSVAYRIDRRERFAFYSADLRDYDAGPLPPPDAFDRWARERAQREDRSTSSRYVSPELVGFVDLDSYGDWRTDATHGNVWVPRVAAEWAPYRYGNWTWVDPWGWTWVDDAPWGYAPSHYGRWTQLGRSWAWVPGPRNVRPVYSPALVAWVGGADFSLTVASGRTRGVGWFPLAPGEVWRPSYDVSREYFTRANVANTVVNNTTVVNIYNNRNDVRISNADYRFRSAPAAVTAVPVDTFVQGRPVQLTQAQMSANAAAQANVLRSAPAQPVVQSLVGSAPRAQAKPPAETLQRPVVARTAPAVVQSIEQRAAQVREGQPVTRESMDRAAPQAAQPAAPQQRPSTASPGGAQPPAPAAQAPAGTVVPGQLRSNVRVVETDKATPKPLPPAPEGGNRAARNEAEKGRPSSPATASPAPAPAPAQAVQPGQPPQPAPGQPGRVAAPPAGNTQPAPAPAPAPAAAPQPAPPTQAAPAAPVSPPAAGRPAQQERAQRPDRPDRPSRLEGPQPGASAPAVLPTPAAPPAPAAAPAPPGRPGLTAPSQPAGTAPGADPPNVDQLRGRNPPGQDRPGGRDERRAQPAQQPPPGPQNAAPPAAPRAAEVPPVVRDVRPAPAAIAPAPAPQAPRQGNEERRSPPPGAVPASPPAPRAADAPQRPAPPSAQPVPPSAQPAPAASPPKPPAETRRQDRDGERGKGKGKDPDKDKDKEDKK